MTKATLVLAAVSLALGAWLLRYDVKVNGSYGYIVLDRWTGSVQSCLIDQC